jgi:hypothetical protein
MHHDKSQVRTTTKAAPSITEEEHDRIIAAAVNAFRRSPEPASCSERMRPAVAAAIAATRDLCAQEHAEATRLAVAATREECERDRAQAVEAAITGTRELCAIEIATYITTIYCKSKP